MPSSTRTRTRSSAAGPATSATRHLEVIRRGIGSDRAVAEILGVAPSQLTRWRRGQVPDHLNADRLAGLALVVEMLLRWVPAEIVEEWMHGPNDHLAGLTPAYLVRHGQVAEVVGAVEAMKAGVFA